MIPVIIGATGTISKSFRKYISNIPGNHEAKELQKTDIIIIIIIVIIIIIIIIHLQLCKLCNKIQPLSEVKRKVKLHEVSEIAPKNAAT